MKHYPLVLAALATLSAGLTAQTTVQVDFGISTQPTAGADWNNAGAASPGGDLPAAIADLVDTTSTSTGFGMTTSKTGTAGTSGAGANYAGPYPAALVSYPASALQDGLFFAQSGGTITLTLTGLSPLDTYDFLFYGARGNNGLVETTFTATGNNSATGSILNGVLNNALELVTLTGIIPDSNGEVVIDASTINGVSNNGGSLNLMVVTEVIPLDTDMDLMPDSYEIANGTDEFVNDANLDKDSDGLSNIQEYFGNDASDTSTGYGQTLSGTADSDGDGVEDGDEVSGALNPWQGGVDGNPLPGEPSDPNDEDSDDDTLTDFEELDSANGSISDPNWEDSDLDLLPDAWEVANNLDPTVGTGDDGATGDPDIDNLVNEDEFFENTDPQDSDTDNDLISDGDEVNGTINPWDKGVIDPVPGDRTEPLLADSDLDGIDDFDEIDNANGSVTDPNNTDTDGDTLEDGYELANSLDPTDPTGDNGELGDPDSDLLSNTDEQFYGSNPQLEDTDSDNLLDGAEVHTHGTDPTLADTDNDLLDDDVELAGTTDPTLGDSDLDGHKDYIELEAGSDPDNIADVPTFPTTTWSVVEFNAAAALSTEGSLLYAENINGDTTVANGISFTGRADAGSEKSSPIVQTLLGNQAVLDEIYDDEVPALAPLLETFWWDSSPDATNIGLTGLTVGKTYLIQFGRADDRDSGNIPGRFAFADAFGGEVDTDPIGPSNTIFGGSANPALLFSGTFTATSTVQEFATGQNLTGGAYSGAALAFIQVREVQPPDVLTVTATRRPDSSTFEMDVSGLNTGKMYQMVRSADLQDGFPTVVDGPRTVSASDTFTDTGASAAEGFYKVEEAP